MPIELSLLERLRGNDPALIELDLSNKGLSTEDVSVLCETLRQSALR